MAPVHHPYLFLRIATKISSLEQELLKAIKQIT